MTSLKVRVLRVALAAIAGVACLFASEKASLVKSGSLVTSAHAIIGRPLTPMSYAGVARRIHTRRPSGAAVGVGVAVGAAAVAAPVYVTPACAQVVNVYGQITTVCR